MYIHTSYKAFVAKAAAGLMQEMVGVEITHGGIDAKKSWNDNKHMYEHLARQARLAAEALAEELDDAWHRVNQETVFFDVQDSPTSKLEGAVYDVVQKLDDLTEEVKKLK